MNKSEWYTSLFDELNEYWAEIVDARSTEKEVEFLENAIATKGLLLDLCCGTGRHSILLCKRGRNVIGLDVSTNLLKIAKKKMAEEDIHLPLVRGEMRHLPFKLEAFVAAISMFTSFGYLPSKKEDIKTLKEVARILHQNGSFLIDIANREHLEKVFQKRDWAEFPNFFLLEKRDLDIRGAKLDSKWIILDKNSGETRMFYHNLRLYSFQQLQRMLKKAGLETQEVYGNYEGQEFWQDSSRLIILAKKK
jgi:ubiquinone/menaquinone biosynthesis C-methylase UbiE